MRRLCSVLSLALVFAAGVAGAQPANPKAPKAPAAKADAPVVLDVAATRKALFGEDLDKAASAATQLGQSKQAGVVDALLDALAMGLHPRVATAAVTALGRLRPAPALEVLLRYARNRNPEVRAAAVAALGALDDKRAQAAWRAALADGDKAVRAVAATVAAERKDAQVVKDLMTLLRKGDDAATAPLAALASADDARRVAEMIGDAPDRLVAECLGLVLLRPNLGKEDFYVDLVKAIGKIPGDDAVVALTNYISNTPEKPPRQSRREAQVIYEQRLGGDGN